MATLEISSVLLPCTGHLPLWLSLSFLILHLNCGHSWLNASGYHITGEDDGESVWHEQADLALTVRDDLKADALREVAPKASDAPEGTDEFYEVKRLRGTDNTPQQQIQMFTTLLLMLQVHKSESIQHHKYSGDQQTQIKRHSLQGPRDMS